MHEDRKGGSANDQERTWASAQLEYYSQPGDFFAPKSHGWVLLPPLRVMLSQVEMRIMLRVMLRPYYGPRCLLILTSQP